MTETRMAPGGTVRNYYLASTDDSDVTLTVGTGKLWNIKHIHAELACTATVGNRVLCCRMTDGTNNLYWSPEVGNTLANQNCALEGYRGATYTTTAGQFPISYGGNTFNVVCRFPLPELWLKAGCTVRIYDRAAIDATHDDMILNLIYIEYDA